MSELAISGNGEQDATMVDVGEKGRPPGDPPDGKVSWAQKVMGSTVGGMQIPKNCLDDEFVFDRLSLEFPDGEDGEPVITIGREVLEVMNGMWKQCMIVKVLGRTIPIASLSRRLREMWKPKGAMHVLDLPRQFFMIRFELEEEYLAALTGGPWRAFGSHLVAQAWSPEFDPLCDEIVTTPVWVRLSNIPVNFYHRAILMGIAKGLGKPLKVDLTTLRCERARFARICVEINLQKPLKGTVVVNGERYFVSYEGLSNICSHCGLYGHLVHGCPKMLHEKSVASPVISRVEEQSGDGQDETGFTVVRRTGRRPEPPLNKVAFMAGGSGTGLGRNLQEITKNREIGNISITNSFENLAEPITESTIREELIEEEANKENEPFPRRSGEGKSGVHAKVGGVWGNNTKGKGGQRDGPRDKRIGGNKPMEVNGLKQKFKPTRPMRGLVFGPTRGENELSASGKRLRVERDSIGRAGGVFDNGGGKCLEGETMLQQRGLETSKHVNLDIQSMGEASITQREPPDGSTEVAVA